MFFKLNAEGAFCVNLYTPELLTVQFKIDMFWLHFTIKNYISDTILEMFDTRDHCSNVVDFVITFP